MCRSFKVWDKEKKALQIKEEKSSGHAKCSTCVLIQTKLDKFRGRADDEGKKLYALARGEKIMHDRETLGERDCKWRSRPPP